MTRKKRFPSDGSIIRISYENDNFIFGIILKQIWVAIYDYVGPNLTKTEEILSKNVLFVQGVSIRKEEDNLWEKIGSVKIDYDKEFLKVGYFFKSHPLIPNKFYKFHFSNSQELLDCTVNEARVLFPDIWTPLVFLIERMKFRQNGLEHPDLLRDRERKFNLKMDVNDPYIKSLIEMTEALRKGDVEKANEIMINKKVREETIKRENKSKDGE